MPSSASHSLEPRRFALPLPRPLWIALATVVLIVVGLGLRFGLPIYRQQVAIREIERWGGSIDRKNGGPDWLRQLIGDERIEVFDRVDKVYLKGPQVQTS